jgi:hypothetical protein
MTASGHGAYLDERKRVVGRQRAQQQAHGHYMRQRSLRVVMPRRKDERWCGPSDKTAYRQRNVVEWLVAQLKQLRRVSAP